MKVCLLADIFWKNTYTTWMMFQDFLHILFPFAIEPQNLLAWLRSSGLGPGLSYVKKLHFDHNGAETFSPINNCNAYNVDASHWRHRDFKFWIYRLGLNFISAPRYPDCWTVRIPNHRLAIRRTLNERSSWEFGHDQRDVLDKYLNFF